MQDKIFAGISIIFGLMMCNSGFNKFFNYMPLPELPEVAMNSLNDLMNSGWVWPLVAIAEIVGGLLLLSKKTRALGAVILTPIVIGIVAFHLALDMKSMPFALLFLAILSWIIYKNRDKYMAMLKA